LNTAQKLIVSHKQGPLRVVRSGGWEDAQFDAAGYESSAS